MGNIKLNEQADAYTAYILLGVRKFIKEQLQQMIVEREEELSQAGNNASTAMSQAYIGYRMALEDAYFRLYDEELPEAVSKSSIDWSETRVF